MADDVTQQAPPPGGGSPSRGAGGTTQPVEAANLLVQGEGAPDKAAPSGLTAAEEAQYAELQAKVDRAQADAGAAELKVEEPHSSLTHANVTVGREWTRVPAHLLAAVENAAASAGVKLTRKE